MSTKMHEYQQLVESSIIVSIGLLMHLNSISVIELKHTKMPLMTPNAASSLFIFSVLCVLSKLRPLWPKALRKPQRFLIFLVELSLILYASDFLLRQVWLPCLKLLNFICHFMGQYVVVANEHYLEHSAPSLSSWIRNDAFYMARFFLAVIAFFFMMDITGMMDFVFAKLRNHQDSDYIYNTNISVCDDDDAFPLAEEILAEEEAMEPQAPPSPFDVNELPYVPQEDLLNLGHRVGARRRRNPMRKSKRAAKLLLNDPENECFC